MGISGQRCGPWGIGANAERFIRNQSATINHRAGELFVSAGGREPLSSRVVLGAMFALESHNVRPAVDSFAVFRGRDFRGPQGDAVMRPASLGRASMNLVQ
jgi:hypothetical protein